MEESKRTDFVITIDEALHSDGTLVVPNNLELKCEVHDARYSIHLESTKMYQNLREQYWWISISREIVGCLQHCLMCQQVKAEHQRPLDFL